MSFKKLFLFGHSPEYLGLWRLFSTNFKYMRKLIGKIDIDQAEMDNAKTDIVLEVAVSVPNEDVDKIAVLKVRPKIINFKKPKSPLRGRYYDNRAHHGHDGSYAGHKRVRPLDSKL